MRRLTISALLALTIGVAVACTSDPDPAPAPASNPPPDAISSSVAPPSTTADPDVLLCQRYAESAPSARMTMQFVQREPALAAGIAVTLLATREAASANASARDPQLQAALAELLAALDEVGNQVNAQLPPGANPIQTKVRVDPTRTLAALDAADAVCRSKGVDPAG